MNAALTRRIVAALFVLSGLGVIGWVVLDDTGDDVGELTIDQAAASSTADATPGNGTDGDVAPSTEPTSASAANGYGDTVADDSVDATMAPARAEAPDIGRASARIGDVDLSPPPAPTGLRLPTIGVDAPIVPVGVDPDGLMTVPEQVSSVGWYRFGGAPSSEQGTTVLAGHVDSRVQGRGAFFDLRAMEVGDTVTVTDEAGEETTWQVTGRRTYEKESLPIDELLRRDGAPTLVLITCGGDFDLEARSYESNVVVEAEPVA